MLSEMLGLVDSSAELGSRLDWLLDHRSSFSKSEDHRKFEMLTEC